MQMIGPAPYFTFWQVAEKWSNETSKPVMDVVQIMRVHSTYKNPHPFPGPPPALIIWPTECFSSQGEVNELMVFNAAKLIEKEPPSSASTRKPTSEFRSNYFTPEFEAALAFLNSSECPP